MLLPCAFYGNRNKDSYRLQEKKTSACKNSQVKQIRIKESDVLDYG
jgi:hypothetical protein